MIQLEVENYCNNCPNFKCYVRKEILHIGYETETITIISCKNKESCFNLVEYLKGEIRK